MSIISRPAADLIVGTVVASYTDNETQLSDFNMQYIKGESLCYR
jgi:hypothetical protein